MADHDSNLPLVGSCYGKDMTPLASLATIATSMTPHRLQQSTKMCAESTQIPCPPCTPPKWSQSTPDLSPGPIQQLRFILRRQPSDVSWGLTVSMLEYNYLILGWVDSPLVSRYTDFAGPSVPMFQYPFPIQHLRPGDVIQSINERPISTFPSFGALREYLVKSSFLSLLILRATFLPLAVVGNVSPNNAYWAAQETHRLLCSQLKHIIKPVPRVVSAERPVFQIHRAEQKQGIHKPSMPKQKALSRNLTNPLFCDENGKQISYNDDAAYDYEDGARASQFIVPVESFTTWLEARKKTWRTTYNTYEIEHPGKKIKTHTTPKKTSKYVLNPLFCDEAGKKLPYDDEPDFSPEDGTRASQFLTQVESFDKWLEMRKQAWRETYKVYTLERPVDDFDDASSTSVQIDFWSHQGYKSFSEWCVQRRSEWKLSYSWNRRKRKQIEEVVDEIVHFPSSEGESFTDWLRVRKSQWRILKRKRQRMEQKLRNAEDLASARSKEVSEEKVITRKEKKFSTTSLQTTGEMLLIDSILEEQERKREQNRKTYDFAFFFDAKLGAPDDVIALCMRFLHPSEHGKLLCVSSKTSAAFKQRDEMWRQLCPSHWILPRRPRKKWHDLYIIRMRQEVGASQKESDDLLSCLSSVLIKGDHLQKVEKLVTEGQQKFSFDVDYVSGVVCERNSLLNLAVINGRFKVVRWLVEVKGADIESHDRGGFTPLLNAAWDGNMYVIFSAPLFSTFGHSLGGLTHTFFACNSKLVRFLMSKGCDRSKVGTNHYTKPMAGFGFKGHTAEGWAKERGHLEVADLVREGL